ncbi:hypothetical protein [Dactylosporangium sp. NPDC048998]|uniref:hypothetical protein n=1 Tax=Dactylosporangium sp. NPDC048998 TaxID=3363976 RepID=UPI003718E284
MSLMLINPLEITAEHALPQSVSARSCCHVAVAILASAFAAVRAVSRYRDRAALEVYVRRGEVWWTAFDREWPVVLLSGGDCPQFRAMQIVAPATAAQQRGFVILSAEVAADARKRAQAVAAAGPAIGGMGIEVQLGEDEGLLRAGVVRMALPRAGRIFCTWQLCVTRDALIEHAGTLSAAKMRELEIAVRLAGIE